MFVVAALKYWYREYEEKLVELLASLLSIKYPPISPNKRKRSNIKQNQVGVPSGEQLLGHLDFLRQHCVTESELQLYQLDCMQKALQQAQAASTELIKKNYGDLFALAEMTEDNIFSSSISTGTRKHLHIQSNPNYVKSSNRKNTTREKSTLKKLSLKDKHTESSDQTSEVSYVFFPYSY